MVLQKIVFIIGMHRCGTSLLSNYLVNSNFSIGKNKNTDMDYHNPNGYFENDSFTNFHDELLLFNNSTWLNINTDSMKYTKIHVEKYRNLIKNEFCNNKLILIKDPRLTFFIDFLKEVCKDLYIYNFIFLTRNKEECKNSLKKSQNITLSEAEQLYNITHKYYTTDCLKIDYYNIIYSNNQVLSKISNYINIKLNMSNIVCLDLYRNRSKN